MKKITNDDSALFPWTSWLTLRERLVLTLCLLTPLVLILLFSLSIQSLALLFTSSP